MSFLLRALCLLLVFSCTKGQNSLGVPLITKLNAPLIAELDITSLNEQIQDLIKKEVEDSVSNAIQSSVQTLVEEQMEIAEKSMKNWINSTVTDAVDKLMELTDEIKKEVEDNSSNVIRTRVENAEKSMKNWINSSIAVTVDELKVSVSCSILMKDCTSLPVTCPRGVYRVFPTNSLVPRIDVFCEKGGWTVVQRRQDGSVDFYRDWISYKTGFGDVAGEYWLGNEYLYQYTTSRPYTLRIEVEDFHGEKRWAEYTKFHVGSESTNYQLTISGYSGTTGDLMKYSNGSQFSTTDRDHDRWTSGACTDLESGCFWYDYCTYTNLNGRYYNFPDVGSTMDTIYVLPWKRGRSDPMKTTVMMIK